MFHSEQSLFGKLITSQRIAKDSTLKLQLLISRQILAALTMAQKKNLITFWFTGTACSFAMTAVPRQILCSPAPRFFDACLPRTEIQAHPRWWRDRCCLTLLDAVCQAALLCECSSHVLMHLQAAQYGMCTPKEKIVFPNERDSVATSPYAAFLLLCTLATSMLALPANVHSLTLSNCRQTKSFLLTCQSWRRTRTSTQRTRQPEREGSCCVRTRSLVRPLSALLVRRPLCDLLTQLWV